MMEEAIAPATFECNNALSYLPLSELNTRYDRSSKQLVTNESHWTGWAGEQLVTIVHKYQHYLNDVRHGQVPSDGQSREVQNTKCTIHCLSNFITLCDITLDITIVIVQLVDCTK